MRRLHAVCSIIPPHIYRHIAEHGGDDDRRRARLALEASAHTRGQREAVAGMRAFVDVRAAQAGRERAVYDAKRKRALPGMLVRGEGDITFREVQRRARLERGASFVSRWRF